MPNKVAIGCMKLRYLTHDTRKLMDSVKTNGGRPPFKWVIGKNMNLQILREFNVLARAPLSDAELVGINLDKLHGYRVEVGGPPDDIRFMSDEYDVGV